ncbi:MAG: HlyD family efflux transporter periplasmic adaptor subunit [Planctomycetaceae bacterium]|nr:HlyD family efflux transporter periplasmic adaptor subunit [Planctomycetaceae bacterium]
MPSIRWTTAHLFRASCSALLVALVLLAGVGAVNRDHEPVELSLYDVQPRHFSDVIELTGNVEPLKSETVSSECRWSTTILSIVPEGTWVQKGDIVCVLDSSEVEEFLRARDVPLIRARATLEGSVQDEELLKSANERRLAQSKFAAQTALNERDQYLHATHPQLLDKLEQDLSLWQEQLESAREEFAYTERLWAQGFVNHRTLDQANFILQQKTEGVRKLQADLFLSNEFTHPRNELRLQFRASNADRDVLRTEIMNSLAETKARLTTLANERRVQIYERYVNSARESIAACTMKAPSDGQVIYANSWYDLSRGRRSVEEGKRAYFQQPIFRIPDERHKKVTVSLHESLITRVRIGTPVSVQLKGFEETPVAGEIVHISNYPKSRSYYTPDVRDYYLDIQLKPTPEQASIIRLKMDANVTISLFEDVDALTVPNESVVGVGGRNFVWLYEDAGLQPRAIQVGESNDEAVCVTAGLREGDRIAVQLTPQQRSGLQEYAQNMISGL